MLRIGLLFYITLTSLSLKAECLFESEFVGGVIALRDTLQNIRSFRVEPVNVETYPVNGVAEVIELNSKFYALSLNEKAPNIASLQMFLLGWDLSSKSFYIYHNNGVSEPTQTLYIGKLSSDRCAINFQISSVEEIDITFSIGKEIELLSLKRNNTNEQLYIEQRYIFSSAPYAN